MKFISFQSSKIVLLFVSVGFIVMGSECSDEKKPTPPVKPIIENLTLPSITGLSVEITSPADHSSVPRVNTVKGTVSGLPSGYVLRVFVNPELVGRWYPQHPVVFFPDTSWSATAYVGDEYSGGQDFYIGAMAVTEEQRRIIDEDISGMTSFVISGQILAIITVTRL